MIDFDLPDELEAREPAEAQGRQRDDVRLLVSRGIEVSHHRFAELPRLLAAGDLLVVNNSATLPAALDTVAGAVVHVSGERADGSWLVELRRPDRSGPDDGYAGMRLKIPEGTLTLREPYTSRLWVADADVPASMVAYLSAHGRPIQYSYTEREWPLSAYQNVYATEPGSAEMPSAGRPLTGRVLAELAGRGILVAPITLHTGVASAEVDEPPYPEWFAVGPATARLIDHVRHGGGRVIAVGTTVVRALESAVDGRGRLRAARGWTDLVIGPEHRIATVDGLLTGLHEPRASHLMMLTAVAGEQALRAGYVAALRERYRWHEFGDVHLLLPSRNGIAGRRSPMA
ncbi:S-adenosylmethionine:tRNA ribosyltransferase-isomerase [Actinoplanes sp. TBRC 11911]|uniref:S-adenosylmethionine:tRNA ribosyltransferase-isomerase n=1 Tax=Actinoplanes sp. TBRC 11911 TaxID=2729386 RepID=UPI00145F49AC|nr:S-adenosylmethionine:tRNA ribosyltransferase-isomerase [Actinoplanes sp. TBRC 11911]NMO50888.1 S-adenosylmethionine:tRNA ribosyltransferase-isomerase [Actinoplanes sp. TBRC 11911]